MTFESNLTVSIFEDLWRRRASVNLWAAVPRETNPGWPSYEVQQGSNLIELAGKDNTKSTDSSNCPDGADHSHQGFDLRHGTYFNRTERSQSDASVCSQRQGYVATSHGHNRGHAAVGSTIAVQRQAW